MLSRIVYYSRNLLRRPRATGERNLTDILRTARYNNAALGVTGALLFDPNYFAQVLEGERSRVSHLFCRICRDERHDAVTVVEAKIIEARTFYKWSMAFVKANHGFAAPFDPTELDGDGLTDLLAKLLTGQDDAINVDVSSLDAGV